jgi:uncharacterized membrane-anchored protein YhcB (DUF1043 family)
MKRDLVSFTIGVVTGVVLGLLVKDKHKKRVQEMLSDHLDQLRKKYDDFQRDSKEFIREGANKAKEVKKDYLSS